MRRRLLSILTFGFFATGLVVAYFGFNEGVLMNYQLGVFGLKEYENFILIVLYGLAAIFSMTLSFGNFNL